MIAVHRPSSIESTGVRPSHLVYRQSETYDRGRRVLDILVSTLAIALSLPLLALAAVAIKLEDRGPVFFRQKRVGRFGRLFVVYKLRTMRWDACGDALSPATSSDSRITRTGNWLRKTSIDELPQFFNVLRGDMALVGPRPEMPFVVRRYEPWQNLRHLATPGITGLWQVTCRSTVPLHKPEATMLDLQYISSASLLTDSLILLKTFRTVFTTKGAY